LDAFTRSELIEFTTMATEALGKVYRPEGFNLGINIGEAAGAGVAEHIHLHVVPRWGGDTNFMSALAATRVLPEGLDESYRRIHEAWTTI
jgi:ATP adenylyltransferase